MMIRTFLVVVLTLAALVVANLGHENSERRHRRRRPSRERSESAEVNPQRVYARLFHYYDDGFRPNFDGEPVQVQVGLTIESMSLYSQFGHATATIVVTERWQDNRLQAEEELEFHRGAEAGNLVWTPGTYFRNLANVNMMQTPQGQPLEKFTISTARGQITHVYRIQGDVSCSSTLCNIRLENFRYPITDVVYEWLNETIVFPSYYVGPEIGSTEAVVDNVDRSYTGTVSQLELRMEMPE